MSNITTIKSANTAYFDSTKGPNTITADQHAVLLNGSIDTLYNYMGINLVIGTTVTFNNEDPTLVTEITMGFGSTNLAEPLLSYTTYRAGDRLDFLFQDGSALTYAVSAASQNAVEYSSSIGSPSFTPGETVTLQIHRYENVMRPDKVVDTQFTSVVPQFFASATRSLLRNNGSVSAASFNVGIWDSNEYVFPTVYGCTIINLDLQLEFTVAPSTTDAEIEIEWGYNNGTFNVLGRKTVHSKSDPFYVNERLYIDCGGMGTDGLEFYLTPNKDIDVYGTKMTFQRILY